MIRSLNCFRTVVTVFSDKANSKKYDGLDELDTEVLSMVNNAMGGFLFVMSTDGDIIYASDSIATHLGLSQVCYLFCFLC